MLLHNRMRFVMTILGISFAFFLASAQIGLMVGWVNTNSALIRHANVNLWVVAEQTSAYDYGSAIPRQRIQQMRSIPGVIWAEGLVLSWALWQHTSGKRVAIELVGLDDSNVGGPWDMLEGTVEMAQLPETVIVDELYLENLGVERIGQEFGINGESVRVGGISQGVRTFTAAPFVFTSLESAIDYDNRYEDNEITYVIARVEAGENPEDVKARAAKNLTDVEILTSDEFAERTVKYWMLETGIGITVIVTAVLGLLVAGVIMSQTLFAITQDHLGNYATLLALGFHQQTLRAIVLTQSMTIGGIGVIFGGFMFTIASLASLRTPIPIETTFSVSIALIVLSLVCCVAASFASIRTIFRLDPLAVFHS
jgi:putative ABC transport system permease protein